MEWYRKTLSCVGSICYYIMLSAFIIFYFFVFLFIFIFVTPFDKKRVVLYYTSKFFSFVVINMCPFWRVYVKGAEKIDPNQTYIIVSNHQSMMDVPLIGRALPLVFRFVSKKEVCKIPFLGWMIWLRGDITIDRGGAKSAKGMLMQSKELISQGVSIMMFPEGTRTKTGKVGRFKEGAFMVAKINSLPIIPVVVEGTWEMNNYISNYLKIPTTFGLTILDPISKEDVDRMSLKELTNHTQNVILSAHREIEPQLYRE